MSDLRRLLDHVLDLRPMAGGFVAEGSAGLGSQALAQVAVAACRAVPGRGLRSLHTVFARRARPGAPLELTVGPMRDGRAFASATVTVRQGGDLCSRSIALLQHPEDAPCPQARPRPEAGRPDDWAPRAGRGPWDVRTADDVDPCAPAADVAELRVWLRFPGAPQDPVVGQALLAYASEGHLPGPARRPGGEPAPAPAPVPAPATVLGQTIAFHEPIDASQWLLWAHRSPHAGRGRALGRADVWSGDALVASVVQDRVTRALPPR